MDGVSGRAVAGAEALEHLIEAGVALLVGPLAVLVADQAVWRVARRTVFIAHQPMVESSGWATLVWAGNGPDSYSLRPSVALSWN